MSDSELSALRERAAHGDNDAIGELIELAAEREDFGELRRLADGGSRDAEDQLVELAAEKEDLDELRRLASAGNTDAAEVLAELTEHSRISAGSPELKVTMSIVTGASMLR